MIPATQSRSAWQIAADLFDPPPPPEDEWYRLNDGWTEPQLDVVADLARWYQDDSPPHLWWIRDRARPKQRPPAGEGWFVWMLKPGRGFGKTRSGAGWFNWRARHKRSGEQMLLAGRTPSDVHDYSLNGPGGLLTNYPDIKLTGRKLIWPNGVVALIRSGANPEEFRGFSGDTAWLEEFPWWDYPELAWDNLLYGMRESDDPKVAMTNTPRPIAIFKEIMRMPSCVVVGGTSFENKANLSAKYVTNVLDAKIGTKLGRQEIGGEMLDTVEGALWSLELIQANRHPRGAALPEFARVATGVDPQGTKSDEEDEKTIDVAGGGTERIVVAKHTTGVVTAAKGVNGHYYVLADDSLNGTPGEWGHTAVAAYERTSSDRIVGEVNFGGQMVEATIRNVKDSVSYVSVHASRGKQQRAEPIAALYEQGKVHHVGCFPAMEDEMSSFVPGESASPNRMDALVWALTYLSAPPEEKETTVRVLRTGYRR